jgi:hypothetical protein
MNNDDQPPKRKKWWRSALRLKVIAGVTFYLGIACLGLSIYEFFVLSKVDNTDSEFSDAFKGLVFMLLPLLSAWMIYISIVMWFYSKQLKSE